MSKYFRKSKIWRRTSSGKGLQYVLLLSLSKHSNWSLTATCSMKVISRLWTHQQTCRALFDLIGSQGIPRLHRIFKNTKRDGWSTKRLLKMTKWPKMTLEDNYHAKDFIELEFYIAIAIYELGSGAALYTLQKSPFVFLHAQPFLTVARTLNCASQLEHQRCRTFLPILKWYS